MHKTSSFALCGLCLALVISPVSTAYAKKSHKKTTVSKAAKLTLSSGYHYSQGDYGASQDTKIKYIPTMAKLKYNSWTAKLTVPYLEITGPGVVVGGGDATTTGTTATPVSTQSGLGDIIASIQKKIKLNKKGTSLKLIGKIKLPTADEDKKLGTGKIDYIFETGLSQVLGKAYVSGKIGRKFAGRTPRYDFRDSWRFSAGGGYQFLEQGLVVGSVYNFKQSSSNKGNNSSQVTAYVVKDITEDWSAQLYSSVGLADGSADNAVGFVISKKFSLLLP